MISASAHPLVSEVYPVSKSTMNRLVTFAGLLEEWQAKTNLISRATVEQIWERHIADSLQIVALKPLSRHWLDLGSGGGFPGLVIAAAMQEHAESKVTLVESNGKKAAFLRRANRLMGSNATIKNSRIEDLHETENDPEIVSARALAGLPKLLGLARPWLQRGAVGLFHKGRDFAQELQECDGLWEFDLIEHQSMINVDSVVLEISRLRRVGS